MKFNVIMGNPPYNDDLYLDFVTFGHKNSLKYTNMIVPAKWQAKNTPENELFRNNIVPYMDKIVMYKETHDIFNVAEPDGICYFIIDKKVHNEKLVATKCLKNKNIESEGFEIHDEHNLVLCNHKILNIINKVGALSTTTDEESWDDFKQSLYMINTDNGGDCSAGTLGFARQTYIREQENGEVTEDLGNKSIEELKATGYVGVMRGSEVVGYKKIKDLFTVNNIDKYKITTSTMLGGEAKLNVNGKTLGISLCNILKPYQVPKGSYKVLKYFNTLEQCKSFVSYYNHSKLIIFLFYFGICGMSINKTFFRFIPTPNNWSMVYEDAPLPDYIPDPMTGEYTDSNGIKHCSLYIKYNLTSEEIDIVESIIRTRQNN